MLQSLHSSFLKKDVICGVLFSNDSVTNKIIAPSVIDRAIILSNFLEFRTESVLLRGFRLFDAKGNRKAQENEKQLK